MDYKKKYVKYKSKYLNLKNKLEGGAKIQRNRDLENEIDIYISVEYYKKQNRKILLLLRNKIRQIKSKSFSIVNVDLIQKIEKNIIYKILEMFNLVDIKFNGIVVTINKLNNTSIELDKELRLEDIEKSIYKDLLVDINDTDENLKPVKYNSMFLTKSNIEGKKQCIKEGINKLYEVCKTKKKNMCKAEEVAIDDCIQNCAIPYKKSKFIINPYGADNCVAKEEDRR